MSNREMNEKDKENKPRWNRERERERERKRGRKRLNNQKIDRVTRKREKIIEEKLRYR